MTYVYPANQIETGNDLNNQLGRFWSDTYGDSNFIEKYTKALGLAAAQTLNDADELAATVSRVDIPIYHTAKWLPITLLNSSKKVGSIPTFGSGIVFGYQPTDEILYQFGRAPDSSVSFPVDNLVDVLVLSNLIADATVIFVKNTDYVLNTDTIVFRDDPFNNPLLTTRQIFDSQSNVVDTEITLWAFRSSVDYNYLYSQFGYVLGLQFSSSDNYKKLINAFFDAMTGGTSKKNIEDALVAITDIPLVKSDNETVVYIGDELNDKLVITDKNVYKFKKTSSVTVSIDQVVNAGDPLVDSLQIFDFNSGTAPSPSLIPSLEIPVQYFQIPLTGSLTFVNNTQNTTVTTVSSHTQITFPITGDSGDVSLFWTTTLNNGIASGHTLAELLDNRPIKIGQPVAANLPATVNPLQFMVSNIFRNNLTLVKIVTEDLGTNNLGLSALSYLRKIIPSNTGLLIDQI